MSTTWPENTEAYGDSEAYGDAEAYGDGEAYGDAEAYGEETRRERERRARIAYARRRRESQQRSRPRPAPPAGPSPRQAITAVRDLDLETKVSEDQLRGRLSAQGRRMSRAEYAATAGVVVDQFMESFDEPQNNYLRAGLRFAPLLLLAPQRRGGGGLESFVTDPRVVGGAAVLGLAFFGDRRTKGAKIADVTVSTPPEVEEGDTLRLKAKAVDRSGATVSATTITWSATPQNVLSFDSTQGPSVSVTAHAPGKGRSSTTVAITATADGVEGDPAYVKVNAAYELADSGDAPAAGAAAGGAPTARPTGGGK